MVSSVEVAYVCDRGEWGVFNMLEGRHEMIEVNLDVTKITAYMVQGDAAVIYLKNTLVLSKHKTCSYSELGKGISYHTFSLTKTSTLFCFLLKSFQSQFEVYLGWNAKIMVNIKKSTQKGNKRRNN